MLETLTDTVHKIDDLNDHVDAVDAGDSDCLVSVKTGCIKAEQEVVTVIPNECSCDVRDDTKRRVS